MFKVGDYVKANVTDKSPLPGIVEGNVYKVINRGVKTIIVEGTDWNFLSSKFDKLSIIKEKPPVGSKIAKVKKSGNATSNNYLNKTLTVVEPGTYTCGERVRVEGMRGGCKTCNVTDGNWVMVEEAPKDIPENNPVEELVDKKVLPKIELGKIYKKKSTRWYMQPESNDRNSYSGPCCSPEFDNFNKTGTLTITPDDFEEITEGHEDYAWLNHIFNKEHVKREEFEKKDMTEAEKRVASGEIEFGQIYWCEDVKSWSKPLGYHSGGKAFGGPYIQYAKFYNHSPTDKTMDLKDPVKLTEDHEDYDWIMHMFEHQMYVNKEDWQQSQWKYKDVVYDFDKMEITCEINTEVPVDEIFSWSDSPQGYDYWGIIDKNGHTEESKFYIEQMAKQYAVYLTKQAEVVKEFTDDLGRVWKLGVSFIHKNYYDRISKISKITEKEIYLEDGSYFGIGAFNKKGLVLSTEEIQEKLFNDESELLSNELDSKNAEISELNSKIVSMVDDHAAEVRLWKAEIGSSDWNILVRDGRIGSLNGEKFQLAYKVSELEVKLAQTANDWTKTQKELEIAKLELDELKNQTIFSKIKKGIFG